MTKMREPDIQQGESWLEFKWRRETDRDALELKLYQAEPWEKEEIRSELSQIWYDLEVARVNLKDDFEEVLW